MIDFSVRFIYIFTFVSCACHHFQILKIRSCLSRSCYTSHRNRVGTLSGRPSDRKFPKLVFVLKWGVVKIRIMCSNCFKCFQGFPAEFAMYLNYCRGLRFDEGPDYMYLRQLFRILFRTLNHQYDYTFDWTMLKQKSATNSGSAVAGAESPAPNLHSPGNTNGQSSTNDRRDK